MSAAPSRLSADQLAPAGSPPASPGSVAVDWRVQSGLPGVVWPAVPPVPQAVQLALLFQLEQSQWWPVETIVARQFEQAHRLLVHAQATVPFYRERLAAAGFSPARPLTPEVFARIPLLHRAELQQRGRALASSAPPAEHGPLTEIRTSGSTGQPVTALGNQLTAAFWNVLTVRDHLWHRRDAEGTLAVIRNTDNAPPPDGQAADNWGRATDGLIRTGRSVALHIGTDIARQMDWLRRIEPAYLLSYPSNLKALAEYALERGIGLPGLREIRSISEVLGSEVRDLCKRAWGAPVTDAYSANELGYMALQCPRHEHLHVQSEAVLLEVLDAAGNPCRPGEIGRVVVTVLHNFAMPLIRYEIGDYAEVGEPCACGRGLPVLKRIAGRVRNLVTLPDGSRHWPSFRGDTWAHIAPLRQLQLVQHDRQTIEARLVCDRRLTESEEAAFSKSLAECFGHRFRVAFTYLDRIERSAGGKYEDFVSRVA